MSFSNAAESAILALIFNATPWANMADNAGTSPQTNIGMSLHTADPGEAGDATTSEIAYTSYTRVNVARNNGSPAFTITAGATTFASPIANIDFPAGTGGSGTASFFAAAKSNATPPTGAQAIHMSGTISPAIVCGSGITPRLTTASQFLLD